MKYDIEIREILSRVISVKSNSVDDAIDYIRDMYRKEEIVLDDSDFNGDVSIEEEKSYSRKDFLINKVIEYIIEDEEKHYEESDEPENHIYNTLIELKKYLPDSIMENS